MMITLTNEFHRKTATLRLAPDGKVSHRTGLRRCGARFAV